MGLFMVWYHRLVCIVLGLCKHACKDVCDVKPGIDPYPLLDRSWKRRWPDFLTFTAWKKSRLGLKRGRKAECFFNRRNELCKRKKYLGVRSTLKFSYYIKSQLYSSSMTIHNLTTNLRKLNLMLSSMLNYKWLKDIVSRATFVAI